MEYIVSLLEGTIGGLCAGIMLRVGQIVAERKSARQLVQELSVNLILFVLILIVIMIGVITYAK